MSLHKPHKILARIAPVTFPGSRAVPAPVETGIALERVERLILEAESVAVQAASDIKVAALIRRNASTGVERMARQQSAFAS